MTPQWKLTVCSMQYAVSCMQIPNLQYAKLSVPIHSLLFIKHKYCFLKLLRNEIHTFNFFFPHGWYSILVGKVTISASLRTIHYPKISEQASLRTPPSVRVSFCCLSVFRISVNLLSSILHWGSDFKRVVFIQNPCLYKLHELTGDSDESVHPAKPLGR